MIVKSQFVKGSEARWKLMVYSLPSKECEKGEKRWDQLLSSTQQRQSRKPWERKSISSDWNKDKKQWENHTGEDGQDFSVQEARDCGSEANHREPHGKMASFISDGRGTLFTTFCLLKPIDEKMFCFFYFLYFTLFLNFKCISQCFLVYRLMQSFCGLLQFPSWPDLWRTLTSTPRSCWRSSERWRDH